jgi:Stage II sporulation protein E (SpoIIE)
MKQGLAGIGVDFPAHAIYINFDQIREGIEGLIPDVLGDIRAPHNAAGVAGKIFEQRIFLGGERHAASRPGNALRGCVQDEVGNDNFGGAELTRAAQQRAKTREQFAELERLGEVIVGAVIEAGDAVLDCIARSQHQNGHALTRFSKLAANFKTVAARNHHVEDHQVVSIDRGLIKRIVAGVGNIDGIRLFAQALGHETRDARIVFDKKQPHASIIRQKQRKSEILAGGSRLKLALPAETIPARRQDPITCSAATCTEESDVSINIGMKFKRVEPQEFDCTKTAMRPFGCMELWAGNEKAHRSLELAGLESDVIAVPAGGDKGGDLSAVFSCSDNLARVVLADCVGHGYTAAGVARHVHHLLHKFQDIRDTAGLLASLNDAFTLSSEESDGPLRLTTVVTGTFDGTSGEFNFAYAAHPRMLLWREHQRRFLELGEGLEGFPLGYITGETYSQQSVRLNHGDMILAFSDGATEVRSAAGEELTSEGFLGLAEKTLHGLPQPFVLQDFSRALLDGVHLYRGREGDLDDDITLLTLRRVAQ